MSSNIVIDAGVLTLYYAGDVRTKGYFDRIYGSKARGYMSSVNLAEYYYSAYRKLGRQTADTRYYQTYAILDIIEADSSLTRNVGLEKCRQHFNLSLADCYALALTKQLHALLLTTDSELAKVKDVKTKYFSVSDS